MLNIPTYCNLALGFYGFCLPLRARRLGTTAKYVTRNGGISTAVLSSPEYAAGPNKHGVGKFFKAK